MLLQACAEPGCLGPEFGLVPRWFLGLSRVPLCLDDTQCPSIAVCLVVVRLTPHFCTSPRCPADRNLMQGLLPNLIKLAPAAGISWYVFEETKMLLGINPGS